MYKARVSWSLLPLPSKEGVCSEIPQNAEHSCRCGRRSLQRSRFPLPRLQTSHGGLRGHVSLSQEVTFGQDLSRAGGQPMTFPEALYQVPTLPPRGPVVAVVTALVT